MTSGNELNLEQNLSDLYLIPIDLNVHADITAIHDQFISTLLTSSISSTSSPPTLSIRARSSFLIPINTT
ncbi:unnamed protein product [Rotaria sordida]|uniref:Uncharacterized protein n=1 Tax=Rotaria sordida TaxID=392033 RepID=A0A813XR49_9BILA|nr:unnamed protein product [Rotaria sordida]